MKALTNRPVFPFLSEKIASGQRVNLYIATSGPVPHANIRTHGFGIFAEDVSGNEIAVVSFKSPSNSTTHMRGALGAVLTCLEFIDANCEADVLACIYSRDEYVSKHLKPGLKNWISDPERPNRDILIKIDKLLDKRPRTEFRHSSDHLLPGPYETARELARLANSGDVECYSREEELDEEADSDWLREQAMAKGPWG